VAKAHGAIKMMTTWGDLSVCLGCVVRVDLTRQDSTLSLWTTLARRV
jgi:hypothetical protein